MTFEELKALDHQYTMQTYGRFDVALDHGKGATLYGLEGEVYTDFASGIGVASLGYGHPAWVKAVSEQAQKLQHASNLFYTEPYAKVAEKLCKRTGMAAVFFANGGGEANEGIIKLARKYSFDKYGMGRSTIITPQLLPRPHHHHLAGHRSGRVPSVLLPLHRGLPLR